MEKLMSLHTHESQTPPQEPYYEFVDYFVPPELKEGLILETLVSFELATSRWGEHTDHSLEISLPSIELKEVLGREMLDKVSELYPDVSTFEATLEFNLMGIQKDNNRDIHTDKDRKLLLAFSS